MAKRKQQDPRYVIKAGTRQEVLDSLKRLGDMHAEHGCAANPPEGLRDREHDCYVGNWTAHAPHDTQSFGMGQYRGLTWFSHCPGRTQEQVDAMRATGTVLLGANGRPTRGK